jgi:hypothetical protein
MAIHADAGLHDRNVQSSKMVHAALLLLMLEAVHTDLVFTISLKRSTQNLQLSTSWPAEYPICLMGWSGRAPNPPLIEAGRSAKEQRRKNGEQEQGGAFFFFRIPSFQSEQFCALS